MDEWEPDRTIYGTDDSETLRGGWLRDDIYGFGGDDLIYGGRNHDRIDGGDGNDRIFGGEGGDRLYGGLGFDEIHGGEGADLLVAGTAGGAVYGDRGEDSIWITSGQAEGGWGDDNFVTGDYGVYGWAAGPVAITGGRGHDSISVAAFWNDNYQQIDILDFRAHGNDTLSLVAYYADGTFIADGPTMAGWLDTNDDGRLDAQDGGAVLVDPAANTLTLAILTDNVTLHLQGELSIDTAWIT